MSGKISRLKTLESRKQLLIAESELNRAHLMHEWQTMAGEVHALAHRAKTVGSIASTTATLVAGLSFLRREKSAPAGEKKSWGRTLLKVIGVVSALWPAFRNRSQP